MAHADVRASNCTACMCLTSTDKAVNPLTGPYRAALKHKLPSMKGCRATTMNHVIDRIAMNFPVKETSANHIGLSTAQIPATPPVMHNCLTLLDIQNLAAENTWSHHILVIIHLLMTCNYLSGFHC